MIAPPMWAGGLGLAAVNAHEAPGIPAPDSFVILSRHPVETQRAMAASRWLAALALDWSGLNPVTSLYRNLTISRSRRVGIVLIGIGLWMSPCHCEFPCARRGHVTQFLGTPSLMPSLQISIIGPPPGASPAPPRRGSPAPGRRGRRRVHRASSDRPAVVRRCRRSAGRCVGGRAARGCGRRFVEAPARIGPAPCVRFAPRSTKRGRDGDEVADPALLIVNLHMGSHLIFNVC